jgi:hypothetical protein
LATDTPIERVLHDAANLLGRLLRNELANMPIEHWGFFFPAHVAVWRFIETTRPGVLGPLKARFSDQPYFEGKGSSWFCNVLGNRAEYLHLLEAIMYPITRNAPDSVRDAVRARGFFRDAEIPPLDPGTVRSLAEVVLRAVDQDATSGAIA